MKRWPPAPGTDERHCGLSRRQVGRPVDLCGHLQHRSGGRVFCASALAGAAAGQRDRAGQRPLPSVADHGGAGRRRRLCAVVSAGLLARPQSHRTPVGRRQNPTPPRPAHRRQPSPFCRHNMPMLLLNAIVSPRYIFGRWPFFFGAFGLKDMSSEMENAPHPSCSPPEGWFFEIIERPAKLRHDRGASPGS